MGGDNKGRVANPWSSSDGGSRSLTPELRSELFALPNRSGDAGRSRSNETSTDYFIDPDGPQASPSFRRKRSAVGAHQNTRKMGRRIGYGAAAAAGATAGLAALIGGERDQREQEQYQ